MTNKVANISKGASLVKSDDKPKTTAKTIGKPKTTAKSTAKTIAKPKTTAKSTVKNIAKTKVKGVPVLALQGISKSYGTTKILENIDVRLEAGTSLALVGTSGCGKSTLLHIAGLLDDATKGTILVDGKDMNVLSDSKRTKIRNECIGFIYQFHNLLPEFLVWENVAYPMWIAGISRKKSKIKALELLTDVDMQDYAMQGVGTLSGGQAQRVAIARALANTPKIVLADEPTGNLDMENSDKVWRVLLKAVKKQGACLLCVTHDMDLAKQADTLSRIKNFKID